MKTISLQDYAKIVGYKGSYPTTLEQIQEFAEDELDWTIWDYPLEEYDYVLKEVKDNNASELVFVDTEIGVRICEI